MADNMSEQAEAIRKKREDARRRKQKQRERQRVERERQKQIQVERDNPINIWERHKKERPEEYAKIL